MLGRSLISLTSITFCFLRASFFFFCSSYLNLPKSRILQTGGSAAAATSTRSSPASLAPADAAARSVTPPRLPRSGRGRSGLRFQSSDGIVQRKNFLFLTAKPAEGDAPRLGFAPADDG